MTIVGIIGIYLACGLICWVITLKWKAYLKNAKKEFEKTPQTALGFKAAHFLGTVLTWPLFVIDSVGWLIKGKPKK